MWTSGLMKSIPWTLLIIIFNLKTIALGHDNETQAEMISSDDSTFNPSGSHPTHHSHSFNAETNALFPEKSQKPFQKHRWKFNLTTFSFIPLENNNDETRTPLSSVPKNHLVVDTNPNFIEPSANFGIQANEAHQNSDLGKFGDHENEENEFLPWKDEDVNLFEVKVDMFPVNNSNFEGVSSTKPKSKLNLTTTMGSKAVNELITIMPDQLNDPGNFENMKAKFLLPQVSHKNIDNEIEENVNTKLNADMELFKIQPHSDDDYSVKESSQNEFLTEQLDTKNEVYRNLESDDQIQNLGNEPLRLIPQLVNVTTENVFVPVDSDENLSDKAYVNLFDYDLEKVKYKNSNSELDFLDENNRKGNSSTQSAVSEEGGEFSEDFQVEQGNTMMMMRRRPRRSVVHLYDMVACATGCNPLIYKGYGCFCGFMGSGYTVDGIDKCCFMHDNCYHHARCPPLLSYFVPYYWTCNAGRPQCVNQFGGWKGICGAHLCECDRQFAECLRNYPCPRSRAMCMTSPFRFWQGLTLRIMS